MSSIDKLAKELKVLLDESNNKQPKAYSTTAEVTRVEDDTIWVHIPGGIEETPVRKTINASRGDVVKVNIENGGAWVIGNVSAPPTDDAKANKAFTVGENAFTKATEAEKEALRAGEAADRAESEAIRAGEAADRAETEANRAYKEAEKATGYANDSLSQLGIVEDVVGTLNWITTHATYKATADTEVHAGKWYFTKSGDTYNVVVNPTGDPSAKGYYEVDTIDEAVSNYVASHLALTNEGLYLTKDGNGYKILLANDGLKVYDPEGHLVSTFGESIIFDSARPQTIGNNNVYIKYYDKNNDGTPDSLAIKADEFLLSTGQTIQDSIESVENWFYSVPPTTSNPPANSWTTTNLKEQHLRDIYFDTTSGKSYRWAKEGTTYKWVEIEDVELAALAKDLHDNYPPRSEFTVAPDKIQSEVAKKVGNSEVISKINQSAETVKIQASKVEIDGTATFNAIKSSVENTVKTAVDGIEIGGRNLLSDRAWGKGDSSYSERGITVSRLELGLYKAVGTTTGTGDIWWGANRASAGGYGDEGDYIYSIYIESGSWPTSGIVLQIADANGTTWSRNIRSKNGETSVAFTIASGHHPYHIGFYSSAANTQLDITFRVKLEKGNKATDWTPAPEDVQSEIDAKKSVHTIDSTYKPNYSTALNWAKTSQTYSNNGINTTGVKVGDTVRLGVLVNDFTGSPTVYVVGTVTAIGSKSSFTMEGKGLDTTIIDGGNILTNSIGANQIKANVIDTSKLTVGAQDEMLNSNIVIGGRNLVLSSGHLRQELYPFPIANRGYWTNFTDTDYDGLQSSIETASWSELWIVSPLVTQLDELRGKKVTLSCELKASNLTTIASKYALNFGAVYSNSEYSGYYRAYEIKQMPITDADYNCTLVNDKWVKISKTFDVPTTWDFTQKSYYRYIFQIKHLSQATTTHTLYFRKPKAEVGNKATDWSPAPEDLAATATSYITDIGSDGIRVHPASTENNSVLINSDGMTIYKGGTADKDSVAFYGDTARIGEKASRHVEVKTGGMQVYNGEGDSNMVTHIGYESVQGETGATMGAFFTFGKRKSDQTKGEYSVAEGYGVTASGYCSHAEGSGTTASGYWSHAEGNGTTASGWYSHAEGHGTKASGWYSHAGGYWTIAGRKSQTAIGEYNATAGGGTNDRGKYVLIVGNGTSDDARSNALTVSWDGNVELAIDSSATGSSTVDGKIMDSLRSLGWDASTEGVIV